MCPCFAYRHPCFHQLKYGECRALHYPNVRDTFEQEVKYLAQNGENLPAEIATDILMSEEDRKQYPNRLELYQGLVRKYPREPFQHQIQKAYELDADRRFEQACKSELPDSIPREQAAL